MILIALPILICAAVFQGILVPTENWVVNFFAGGHSYGAPFPVGAAPVPGTPVDGPAPTPPERFSVLWFAVDVVLTAAAGLAIALFLRTRNAWPAALVATIAVVALMARSPTAPTPFQSYGLSFWTYWVVAFAMTAAAWTLLFERSRARPHHA